MKKLGIRVLVVAIISIVLLDIYQYGQIARPQMVSTNGRTFERAVVTEVIKDNIQENGSRIGDQIVKLRLVNGDQQPIVANSPNGLLFGTVCRPGLEVVVISSRLGNTAIHTVYGAERSVPIFIFVGSFLLLLCLIGGKKGVKSALALIVTFVCFIGLFFPMLLHGIQPIPGAVITSFLVLSLTIYLINGWTIKAVSAALSAFCGVLVAGIIALAFGYFAGLSGYNVSNIESLMFVAQNTSIDVSQILFAGILFASLGAVMDITMDIAAAVEELRHKKPDLTATELFNSGMKIGRDVMGTMSATLILAFFGGSLGTWVIDYVYNLPYLQLINSNSIGIQIMQGLSGSFGVILAVPFAALFSAKLPDFVERYRRS